MAGQVGCTQCGISFKNESQRNRHNLKHGPLRLQCMQCLRVFIRRDVYNRHFKRQHVKFPGQIVPSPVKIMIANNSAPTTRRLNQLDLLYQPPTEQQNMYSPRTNWQVPTRPAAMPPIPFSTTCDTTPLQQLSAELFAESVKHDTLNLGDLLELPNVISPISTPMSIDIPSDYPNIGNPVIGNPNLTCNMPAPSQDAGACAEANTEGTPPSGDFVDYLLNESPSSQNTVQVTDDGQSVSADYVSNTTCEAVKLIDTEPNETIANEASTEQCDATVSGTEQCDVIITTQDHDYISDLIIFNALDKNIQTTLTMAMIDELYERPLTQRYSVKTNVNDSTH